MPTINQLIRKPRKPKPVRNKVPALQGAPTATEGDFLLSGPPLAPG